MRNDGKPAYIYALHTCLFWLQKKKKQLTKNYHNKSIIGKRKSEMA